MVAIKYDLDLNCVTLFVLYQLHYVGFCMTRMCNFVLADIGRELILLWMSAKHPLVTSN